MEVREKEGMWGVFMGSLLWLSRQNWAIRGCRRKPQKVVESDVVNCYTRRWKTYQDVIDNLHFLVTIVRHQNNDFDEWRWGNGEEDETTFSPLSSPYRSDLAIYFASPWLWSIHIFHAYQMHFLFVLVAHITHFDFAFFTHFLSTSQKSYKTPHPHQNAFYPAIAIQ